MSHWMQPQHKHTHSVVDTLFVCPAAALPRRLPLAELHMSGLASEHSVYALRMPEELAQLAGTLQRLELPRCALWALPEPVAQLSSLTALDLSCNSVVRLPDLRCARGWHAVLLDGPGLRSCQAGCRACNQSGLQCCGTHEGAHRLVSRRTAPCSKLGRLQELDLFGSPATNAAYALQPCKALRRLGLGSRRYAAPGRRAAMDGGPGEPDFGGAYADEEAWRWEAAYLDTVRAALPWVQHVGARHGAQLG